jgi:hypothetical protein
MENPEVPNDVVDACICNNGSEFDIANLASLVLGKSRHRYTGTRIWEYFDGTKWSVDPRMTHILKAIRLEVAHVVMERSLYWQERSKDVALDDKFECQLRSMRLLQVCAKIKNYTFLTKVVKECRAFFEDETLGC